jgi:hypothetical protein
MYLEPRSGRNTCSVISVDDATYSNVRTVYPVRNVIARFVTQALKDATVKLGRHVHPDQSTEKLALIAPLGFPRND